MSRIVHITSDWSYFTWSIFLWNIEFYHLFLTRLIIKIIKITKKKKNKAAAFITIFLEYCSHFCQFSVLRDNFVRYNAREASFASPFIFCVPVYRDRVSKLAKRFARHWKRTLYLAEREKSSKDF